MRKASTALPERVDAVIDRMIEKRRLVGAVVLVAEGGKIVHRRAAGFADREAGRPMAADAIFRLASFTKPIVSVAAMALIEQGRLALEDPVTRFLPDFRPRLPDGRIPVITIRHLMTHTSGLIYGSSEPPDGPYHRAGVSDGLDMPGRSMADNLTRIASAPLAFEPGTQWRYSVATDVLGAVLELAGNAPLPEIVARLVTGPLGMKDTAFTVHDVSRLAVPYADGPEEPVRMGAHQSVPFIDGPLSFAPDRIFDPTSFASGGGGMAGTAGDFMVFLEALRKGGAPVLNAESMRLLTTNSVGNLQVRLPGWGWGLGFSLLKDPAPTGTPQAAGTWRWGGVYGHVWFVDPARGLTVVSLTNTAVAGLTPPYPDDLRNAVYGV